MHFEFLSFMAGKSLYEFIIAKNLKFFDDC